VARSKRSGVGLSDLVRLVKTLRDRCPWDKAQTLNSIKHKVVEEAHEFAEAVTNNDSRGISEEIGDLLFLSLFLVKVYEDEYHIPMNKLIASVIEKYRRKHPHVFSTKKFKNSDEVLAFWHKSKKDIFAGVPLTLPALLAAKTIQERARRVGFDWETHKGPLQKVQEEITEIRESVNTEEVFEEYGDLLFACVNLARHLSVDPEDALKHANKKFVTRFRRLTEELKRQGKNIEKVSLKEMDQIWDEIKKEDG
jgi:tetrapyrrole methylase family protein/MazG family protein